MDWIDDNWMFVTLPVSLLIAAYKHQEPKTSRDDRRLMDLVWYGWVAMPVYAIHQLEEHGYDAYGRRYHFIHYFNEANPFGVEMTPRFISIINLVQVHVFFAVYAHWSATTGNPLYAALTHGLMATNSVMAHIVPATLSGQYNPGLAQSIFMMAPFSIFVLYQYYQYQGYHLPSLLVCLVFGSVWGHAISLAVPLILVGKGILNEWGYLLWTSAASILFPVVAGKLLPNAKGRKD